MMLAQNIRDKNVVKVRWDNVVGLLIEYLLLVECGLN